ncbi:hypothetical protein niasHT_018524 [Heterodera trifolii]|uniref:TIL domain-containing protein n=1 Tax=Heterodera trifolii TaxID=157864 RepID=A0ABD2LB64_9BILA
MFKNFSFFLLFIAPFIAAYEPNCKCPENEEPGQLSCNRCEPSCYNPRPRICTLMFCTCSCDCAEGFVRDKKTKNCVSKEKCT